eukprot:m.206730 g.206730  ORF g.206730 m.206730 type:complete len:335 (-) comp25363_c0_seq1:872-1876(-)
MNRNATRVHTTCVAPSCAGEFPSEDSDGWLEAKVNEDLGGASRGRAEIARPVPDRACSAEPHRGREAVPNDPDTVAVVKPGESRGRATDERDGQIAAHAHFGIDPHLELRRGVGAPRQCNRKRGERQRSGRAVGVVRGGQDGGQRVGTEADPAILDHRDSSDPKLPSCCRFLVAVGPLLSKVEHCLRPAGGVVDNATVHVGQPGIPPRRHTVVGLVKERRLQPLRRQRLPRSKPSGHVRAAIASDVPELHTVAGEREADVHNPVILLFAVMQVGGWKRKVGPLVRRRPAVRRHHHRRRVVDIETLRVEPIKRKRQRERLVGAKVCQRWLARRCV